MKMKEEKEILFPSIAHLTKVTFNIDDVKA
jgi:hypothetical protein